MSKEIKVAAPAFPLFPILGIIFITLKLTGNIAWSWLWVLSPFWIPLAIGLAIFFFILLIAVLAVVFGK